MGVERRRTIRLSARLLTTFKQANSAAVERALTRDISGDGVCFVADKMLEPGTPLEVTLQLPDREGPVTFLGHVIWSRLSLDATHRGSPRTAENAVRFVSIHPKDRELIMQYAKLHALPS